MVSSLLAMWGKCNMHYTLYTNSNQGRWCTCDQGQGQLSPGVRPQLLVFTKIQKVAMAHGDANFPVLFLAWQLTPCQVFQAQWAHNVSRHLGTPRHGYVRKTIPQGRVPIYIIYISSRYIFGNTASLAQREGCSLILIYCSIMQLYTHRIKCCLWRYIGTLLSTLSKGTDFRETLQKWQRCCTNLSA